MTWSTQCLNWEKDSAACSCLTRRWLCLAPLSSSPLVIILLLHSHKHKHNHVEEEVHIVLQSDARKSADLFSERKRAILTLKRGTVTVDANTLFAPLEVSRVGFQFIFPDYFTWLVCSFGHSGVHVSGFDSCLWIADFRVTKQKLSAKAQFMTSFM